MTDQIEAVALTKFLQALTTIGARHTIMVLETAIIKDGFQENDDVQFITQIIALTFKFPQEEIFQGVRRRDERGLAVAFCAYYLKKHFKYDVELIAHMLKKSVWTTYKGINQIVNLDASHPRYRKFHEWKTNIFDKKVQAYQSGKTVPAKTTKQP